MFETNRPDVRLLVLRAIDVPPYVERGAAHLGIAGKDTLLEYGSDMLCEPVDLQLSKCRLMTATQKRSLNFRQLVESELLQNM